MEPTNKINDCGEIPRKEKNNRDHMAWKVLGIFAVVIALVCGVVFLYNYGMAYDNTDDWIPPSFAVIYYHFCVAVVAIIASVFLKSIWKNRVRFWLLFLASVLIPIICYQFNYHTLKKDGILYPLVDEGGIFHFMAIGDYDFDGMNDEQHHRLYEEREYSSRYGGHFDDTIIDYIDTTAEGVGLSLNGTHCSYDWKKRTINLSLQKAVEHKKITIEVAFKDEAMAQSASFYLAGEEETLIHHTLNDRIATIVFDAEICAKWQGKSSEEYVDIPIRYVLDDQGETSLMEG